MVIIMVGKTLHEIWNNTKGKQVELFWSNVTRAWSVRTYVLKSGVFGQTYDVETTKDFSGITEAKKYAARLTKAKGWKKLK